MGVEGWIFTLAVSKIETFLMRRIMTAAVRATGGVNWVPLPFVVLAYISIIAWILYRYVEYGRRFLVFRTWLLQWFFATTVVEAAWCYVRWKLWRRFAAKLEKCGLTKWFGPGQMSMSTKWQ